MLSMKTKVLSAILACTMLCGCASQYVITLHNGRRITAASKPRLDKGNYVFKDAEGKPAFVAAGRVREVAPASMAKEDTKGFTRGPGQR
jgi:hypothetical protein